MEAADEPQSQHAGDPLALPSGFFDVGIPLSSVHDLLRNPQLDLGPFDFPCFDSREFSPTWPLNASSPTDNLSNHSSASLSKEYIRISPDPSTESNGISPNPSTKRNSISPNSEATSTREEPPLCRNSQGRCIDLATRVLSSIHAGSSSCILSMIGQGGDRQPQPSRGADAVLSMNQSALQAVRAIIKCSCCGNPQVLLLVTVICSRIGASYRQVIDIYSKRRNNSNSNGAVSPAGVGKVETQRRDFFIGNHRLGKDVEAALIRQVLSGMLQELQLVIEDIAGHAGQSPVDNETWADPMLSGVRARMVAFLQTQVRALTSALDHSEGELGAVLSPVSLN